MAVGIRTNLSGIAAGENRPVSHAGLEMDRYLRDVEYGGAKPRRADLLARLTQARPAPLYAAAYRRWQSELARLPHVKTCVLTTRSPLQVGLGAASVLDLSLALHRTYGTPLVPGRALKGAARRAMVRLIGDGRADYLAVLFGSALAAGYVDYLDAWYVPDSAPDGCPLRPEGLTPHHPDYYTGPPNKRPAPTDCDDPNPVGGLSAHGDFLLVVRGPNEAVAAFALELLTKTLDEWGVGGKTNSSMGRLRPKDAPPPTVSKTNGARRCWADPPSAESAQPPVQPPSPVQSPSPAQPPVNALDAAPVQTARVAAVPPPGTVVSHPVDTGLAQRIQAVPPGQEGAGLRSLGLEWMRLPEGGEKRATAGLLHRRLREANLLHNFVWEEYPWLKALVSYIAAMS